MSLLSAKDLSTLASRIDQGAHADPPLTHMEYSLAAAQLREQANIEEGFDRAEANEKDLHAENLRLRSFLAAVPFPESLERMVKKFSALGSPEYEAIRIFGIAHGMPADLLEAVQPIIRWLSDLVALHKEIVGGGN